MRLRTSLRSGSYGMPTYRATVRFPLDQPLPLDLFRRLVELLLAQRREDAAGQA